MRVILLLLLLTACASPHHEFWGADAVVHRLDGRDYAVYVDRPDPAHRICLAGASLPGCRADRHPRVQVIRTGYAPRREHVAILHTMIRAAEEVSGCRVAEGTAEGDTGVLTARLLCPP